MSQPNFLKEKLEEFTSTVDPKVWEHIDAALNQNKSKRLFLWFWFTGAAILVLAIGASLFRNSNDTANKFSQKSNEIVRTIKPNSESENQTKKSNKTILTQENKTSKQTAQPYSNHNTNPSNQSLSADQSAVQQTKRWFTSDEKQDPATLLIESDNQLKEENPFAGSEQIKKMPMNDILKLNLLEKYAFETTIITDPKYFETENSTLKQKRWEMQLFIGMNRAPEVDHIPYPTTWLALIPENEGESFDFNALSPISTNEVQIVRPLLGFVSFRVSRIGQNRIQYTSGITYQRYALRVKNQEQINLGAHAFELPFLLEYNILEKNKFSWSLGVGIGTSHARYNDLNLSFRQTQINVLMQSNIRYRLKNEYALQLGLQGNRMIWSNQNTSKPNIFVGLQVGATKKF